VAKCVTAPSRIVSWNVLFIGKSGIIASDKHHIASIITMLKLAVASYDNAAPSAPLMALFGRERRTLGRGEDNYFVLPDPSREVARAQAALWHDGARHRIVNLSDATPLSVNGQELRRGQEAPLVPGDQVKIGLYLIRAEAAPAVATDSLALKEAFLRGAGIAPDTISADLTPETMELIGKLLATSLQGTIDLLAMRSLVKQEVKADVTVVVLRNNNPLKFFGDSQTVLTQMLRKKMPGFLEPLEAVEDAYLDLRGHQKGVVAGMRASVQAMMARLKPARLEADCTPSLLDKLIPGRRHGRLWKFFGKQHAVLAGESQDPFKTVFGPAFLSAYEAEAERVNSHAAAK
jgi:predicted component of type VI protein secretion system